MNFRKPAFHHLLIGIALFVAQIGECTAQPNVHLISVADTVSKNIAQDMKHNLAFFRTPFRAGIPAEQLKQYELIGDDFNSDKVLETIRSLTIAPDDAVVFYYCGHGFYDQGTYFTPPADEGKRLNLKDIRNAIRALQPRLSVSIVDCCSVSPTGQRSIPREAPRLGPEEFSPLCTELFLKSSGDIAINSSAPGEYALCGVPGEHDGQFVLGGSLFSHMFASSMSKHQKEEVAWKDLLLEVRSQVDDRFKKLAARNQDGISLSNGQTLRGQKTQTVWANRDDEDWIPFQNP
jgi:hypothetical protein